MDAEGEVAIDEGVGPALVLIHGVAADSGVWNRLLPHLSAGFRMMTVDLPGLSLKSLDRPPMSLLAHCERVDQALVARGVQQYSIVGHSYGASVALMCAQNYPSRVECVTAIAPGGFGPEINPVLRLMTSRTGASFLGLVHVPAVRKRVERSVERYRQAAKGSDSIDELLDVYYRLETKEARRFFRQSITAVMRARRDYADALVGAPGPPVQVIWGDNDLVLPVWQSQQAAQALKARSVHIIPGAGHAPHRTHPELLAGLVRRFWSEHVGSPAQSTPPDQEPG